MAINKKGILGEKLGMTQVWDENNRVVPVTVVKAGPCVVTQVRTPENDGVKHANARIGGKIIVALVDAVLWKIADRKSLICPDPRPAIF